MKFLNRLFHFDTKGATLKNEIIGGIVTFIAMCYILPVNAGILSDMGMNSAGVFTMTAIISFAATLLMGLVANYPIVLSAGMGLNAFIAYTLGESMGFTSWHQKMILLTVAGIIFFTLSLTPVRKKILEAIPMDLRLIISGALGAFIIFVGLKNSGLIGYNSATYVSLGNFADPAVIIALVSIVVCFGLMFVKNPIISNLAIPMTLVVAAIVGVVISSIMISNGNLVYDETVGAYVYSNYAGLTNSTTLPIAPWLDSTVKFGLNGESVKEVIFYGLLSDGYNGQDFANDLGHVFATPATYVAIFSLVFVNLFDTTATLLAISGTTGMIDDKGNFRDYNRIVIADATGALICAPLGTSTVTSFAESNVGVSLGAKTGFAAIVSAFLFLLCAFVFPVFSIFTSGSVTAAALVCVGSLIAYNACSKVNFKADKVIGFTTIVTIVFAVLCYSVSDGIGIGLLCYIAMMLISGRRKEIKLPIYIIAAFFLVAFTLNTIIKFI